MRLRGLAAEYRELTANEKRQVCRQRLTANRRNTYDVTWS